MKNKTNAIVVSRENNIVIAVDLLTALAVIAFIAGLLVKAL